MSNTNKTKDFMKKRPQEGFTIVELITVIVIIGILAGISIVSYGMITRKTRIAAVQSDLANASKMMEMYYGTYGVYPTTFESDNCPSMPNADTRYCLKSTDGGTFEYTNVVPSAYNLKLTDSTGDIAYSISDDTKVVEVPAVCPTEFIPVPGSSTYGTHDFCVMKYEAKNVGGVATSQADGTPWNNIDWAVADTKADSACSGCHLINEAEWMTIAQNVLSVASNWSGGAVGSGYIYRGYNDNTPLGGESNGVPLRASSTNDNDGYYLTGNSSPSDQRRTLTLTNGETIWDLAGNVAEWVDQTIGANQQPGWTGESGFNPKEWTDATLVQNGLASTSMPSSVALTGAGTWNSSNGIGQLYSNLRYASSRVFIRGGAFDHGTTSGVLQIKMHYGTTGNCVHFGFRAAK